MRIVRVGDLIDQIGKYPKEILRCDACDADYSAHAGDYTLSPASEVMRCTCGVRLRLVTRHVVYRDVQRARGKVAS